MPGARWLIDTYLVEGARGVVDSGAITQKQRALVERYRGPAGWYDHLPGIERRIDVAVRAELALARIGALWPHGHVVVVAHAGVIWRIRMRIEGWSVDRYVEETRRSEVEIGNCDAVEYRRAPDAPWFTQWRHVLLNAMVADDPPPWIQVRLALVDSHTLAGD
jgi:broad specificity phosphatase PhoE